MLKFPGKSILGSITTLSRSFCRMIVLNFLGKSILGSMTLLRTSILQDGLGGPFAGEKKYLPHPNFIPTHIKTCGQQSEAVTPPEQKNLKV